MKCKNSITPRSWWGKYKSPVGSEASARPFSQPHALQAGTSDQWPQWDQGQSAQHVAPSCSPTVSCRALLCSCHVSSKHSAQHTGCQGRHKWQLRTNLIQKLWLHDQHPLQLFHEAVHQPPFTHSAAWEETSPKCSSKSAFIYYLPKLKRKCRHIFITLFSSSLVFFLVFPSF